MAMPSSLNVNNLVKVEHGALGSAANGVTQAFGSCVHPCRRRLGMEGANVEVMEDMGSPKSCTTILARNAER